MVYYESLSPVKSNEAIGAIEELVCDLGQKCVLEAISASSIAPLIGRESSSAAVQQAVIFTLSRIIDAPDARKEADILSLASGLSLRQNITITGTAKKYGVTKADISKSVVETCEQLGLPPSHAMLPEASREKYRMANKRNYKEA